MSAHEDTLAVALGEKETPMQRLQRQRDEAVDHLEWIAASYGHRRSIHIRHATAWLRREGLGERGQS